MQSDQRLTTVVCFKILLCSRSLSGWIFMKGSTVMPMEAGGCILGKLPLRYPADRAHASEPLVAQPSGCTAVPRIVYRERLAAMGGNNRHVTMFFNGPDSMQQPFAGWPQFDFIDQPKQFHPFAKVTNLWWFAFLAPHRESSFSAAGYQSL